MSRAIIDGGPAFPVPSPDFDLFTPDSVAEMARLASGMSLRDYFAAKAMQGMVSCEFGEAFRPDNWAEYAYKMADAMLAARGKAE